MQDSGLQYLHRFKASTEGIDKPLKFNFPFYYEPHQLTLLAANQLQEYLMNQNEWNHNFGIDPNARGDIIGKMFGVMVVKDEKGRLGYLQAVSGKLANSNTLTGFVPPVFDMLKEDGFYKVEEREIDKITQKVLSIEEDPKYQNAKSDLNALREEQKNELALLTKDFREKRKQRRLERQKAKIELTEDKCLALHDRHREISFRQQYAIKQKTESHRTQLTALEVKFNLVNDELISLKRERKQRSNFLQNKLFDQYVFLNKNRESKDVKTIFESTVAGIPSAGAGECAAPKLLQFAYQNDLEPICFGEFWWGQAPKSEVRKHKNFYPSCRGKCEPILSHMLEGLEVDMNPMLINPAEGKTIEIIYEDEALAIINKPAEFLSVPGRSISDSVYLRMRQKYPNLDSPLIVHRLDMSTSGIMIIAKTKSCHKYLQKEFLRRNVSKKYVAVLDGIVKSMEGEIDLPLRLDIENRPQQCVCYEHGKHAKTIYKVISKNDNETRINFWPVTGRTHQLRVHAAHVDGLNCAIKGDDMYGVKGKRLHLHAAYIQFKHPISHELVEFECDPEF